MMTVGEVNWLGFFYGNIVGVILVLGFMWLFYWWTL